MTLPADRLFAGRTDLLLLTVDPTGLDVRFEPGMPYDPPGMTFPHAYGAIPSRRSWPPSPTDPDRTAASPPP